MLQNIMSRIALKLQQNAYVYWYIYIINLNILPISGNAKEGVHTYEALFPVVSSNTSFQIW